MSLSELLTGSAFDGNANAKTASSANHRAEQPPELARLAGLALAGCQNPKAAAPPELAELARLALAAPPESKNTAFMADHWRQAITAEANRAMAADGGALGYCSDYAPVLHRAALAAANELDAAYVAEDQHRCRAAIAAHRRACDATTKAHQRPRTSQSLTAAECLRFCEAHKKQQGGSCPHTGKLDGCLLWSAKNRNLPLAEVPIDPRRYLAGHHG